MEIGSSASSRGRKMRTRLRNFDHTCGYDRNPDLRRPTSSRHGENCTATYPDRLGEVPAGDPTRETINESAKLLRRGTSCLGGNSKFTEPINAAAWEKAWFRLPAVSPRSGGLENGYA